MVAAAVPFSMTVSTASEEPEAVVSFGSMVAAEPAVLSAACCRRRPFFGRPEIVAMDPAAASVSVIWTM